MSIVTIGGLVGALNAAKEIQALAANFCLNYREHAQGVNGVTIPTAPFVVTAVQVEGTPDIPRLCFALVWTETRTWQVDTYHSPDDEAFCEAWGSDNRNGSRIESARENHELRISFTAAHLLLSNAEQIRMMKKWKADDEAKKAESQRLAQINHLQKQLADLQAQAPTNNQ